MKYKQIHITSSLRQERNINNPRHFLQNINNKGFGSLCIRFMESLVKRGIGPGVILRLCTDLRPFLEYIEDTHRITVIAGLDRSHVEAYAASVFTAHEARERTFTNAANANDLLSAVRMFCLYLYTAGVLPEDYGLSVPVIPFPDPVPGLTSAEAAVGC